MTSYFNEYLNRLQRAMTWPFLSFVKVTFVILVDLNNRSALVVQVGPGDPSNWDCVTAGLGTTSVNSLVMTTILQKSSAYLVDKDECNDVDCSI